MTKGKNKKMKTTKNYLFLLPPLPSQDGGGVVVTPHPPTFFMAKIFEKFFHRYMGIWRKGRQMDHMAILAKTQKRQEGKSERGGGFATIPASPPPNREV